MSPTLNIVYCFTGFIGRGADFTCMSVCVFHKYVIGSVYRRPSDLLDDLTQFIEEFSVTLSNIHAVSRQAYVNGDYNIDLLQLHTNTHYNAFYEKITAQGFFPKITRPTRSMTMTINDNENVFI